MALQYDAKTKMLMQVYYGRLGEKERRRYAAIEAVKLGHGGVKYISEVLSVDAKTIRQGKQELLELVQGTDSVLDTRQRKQGGGRKKNDKTS
jgi:hypothetical protein